MPLFSCRKISILLIFIILLFSWGCNFFTGSNKETEDWDTLQVNVSAYNSVEYQTDAENPEITAWGDSLQPGVKVIAVSRDLLKKGLIYNTKVKIEGFPGIYRVKDKMHYRWKNKIDIYMGENVKKAKNFGRKKLTIYYVNSNTESKKLSPNK